MERRLVAGIGAAVLAAGLGLWSWRARSRGLEASEPVLKGPIVESVYGIGTVTATRSYQLRLGVVSTVEKLFVREGDRVRAGQRLVQLSGPGAVAAPFDGTVTFLPVKVGETVFPQAVVLSVVDLADRYVVVSLEQRAALRVRHGQKARVSLDTMRGEVFEGTVQAVYSSDNAFLVRIDVSGLPPQVLPGMTADVGIGTGAPREALLLPVAAIDRGRVAVRRASGALDSVAVETGVVDGAMAEVVSPGLGVGDRVVLPRKADRAR